MTGQVLQICPEHETLWLRRRDTLRAAAAWLALGAPPAAMAHQHSNVVELVGDVQLNGQRLLPNQTVQTGDQVKTGPASRLIFVIGDSAFQVRPNSHLLLERGSSLTTVSQLRLYAGAVTSVWGASSHHQILTPGLNATFRGAGVYAEVSEKPGRASYLCNCYGSLALSSGNDKTISASTCHEAFWAISGSNEGYALMPADSINHTDEQLEFLAHLINQKTAWQVSGKSE